MLVGKHWRIESDSMNIIVSKRRKRTKRTGEPYEAWEIMGYFATVPHALQFLVSQGVRDTQLTDLKTIVTKIDKLENLIETSLQNATVLSSPIRGEIGIKPLGGKK